ncbi:flagellar hook-length control protein FliK [Sphingosinithalassobacter sp. CS137]|uniref:flagellar hook-length control protein FliK n=1 Tax=Sphingosinithalassobacter sp. CS137 TaxID=2762748 RepID=UPI00165E74BE|nr:flagellar hook-length control protein FliK [Sphingosinithalassobacter sp. CS137]
MQIADVSFAPGSKPMPAAATIGQPGFGALVGMQGMPPTAQPTPLPGMMPTGGIAGPQLGGLIQIATVESTVAVPAVVPSTVPAGTGASPAAPQPADGTPILVEPNLSTSRTVESDLDLPIAAAPDARVAGAATQAAAPPSLPELLASASKLPTAQPASAPMASKPPMARAGATKDGLSPSLPGTSDMPAETAPPGPLGETLLAAPIDAAAEEAAPLSDPTAEAAPEELAGNGGEQPVPQAAALAMPPVAPPPRDPAQPPATSAATPTAGGAAVPAAATDLPAAAPAPADAAAGGMSAGEMPQAELPAGDANSRPQPEAVARMRDPAAPLAPPPVQTEASTPTSPAPQPASAAPAPAREPSVTARPGVFGRELGVEIARGVAGGEDVVRVRLNPAELGRIDVTLAFEDGALRATVRAESPAALELLRRDTADLGRALDQAGVRSDAQSFRFESRAGDGGQGRSGGQPQPNHTGRNADPEPSATEAPRPTLRGTGRVDLLA